MTRLLLIAALLCLTALGAHAKKPPKEPPPPPQPQSAWTKVGTVSGVTGAYTPFYIVGNTITVYGNTDGNVDGQWYRRTGTWSSVGAAAVVFPYTAIYDEGPATYRVRTSAVQRGPSGRCYAMLATGNGYPTTDGYRPAWATADDCVHWTYHGHMVIEGGTPYVQTDTDAMVVQESGPATVDHAYPGANRYLAYVNYYCISGFCVNLALVYSADGVSWFFARNIFVDLQEIWPLPDSASFPTATRTTEGVHIIAGNTWPATAHRHVFSCDGVNFRLIEANAATNTGTGKGTNLAYDAATNTLHAQTSGAHFTLPARSYPC